MSLVGLLGHPWDFRMSVNCSAPFICSELTNIDWLMSFFEGS